MNITAYIQGFNAYLELQGKNSNREYVTNGNTASIFMYSNEFKTYLQDEIGVDVKSLSITDLLNMDIENGKLVDKSEQNEETSDSEETENLQNELFGAQNDEQQPADRLGADNADGNKDATTFDFLNLLISEDSIKKVIDSDSDGNLTKDEVNIFLNTIKDYDENGEDVSLNDILEAAQAIQDGTFGKENSTDEEAAEQTPQAEDTQSPEGAAPTASSDGTSSQSSPSSGTQDGNYTPDNNNNSDVQEKTLDNMSKDELKTELGKASNEVQDKQNNLKSLLDGSDSTLKSLKEAEESAYDKYQEELKKVDEELAGQVDELKEKIDTKEQEIDKKSQEISEQKMTVSDCENTYNSAIATRENLEGVLSNLKGADTSNMSEEAKADLQSKISEVEGKLATAKQEEENAKTAKKEAEEKLTALNEEKTKLQTGEGGLDKLNEQMAELEKEISEKYPEIKEFLNTYNEASKEYDNYKNTSVTKAEKELDEAKEYEGKVKTAYNNADNKEVSAKYSLDPKNLYNAEAGNALAAIANHTDGTVGLCLNGVAKSVRKWLGESTQLSHLGSAYMAVEALRTDPVLTQHFKEVQVDRSELSSLPAGAIVVWDRGAPNATAAGKKHGHISIALGNGQESSDHIQKQMTTRQSQFYVFYPIG